MVKRKKRGPLPLLLSIALFAGILCLLNGGLADTKRASDAEGLRIAEQSVRRGAVACYATEGRYPESYAYLQENYGLHVDTEKYAIHYEIFAENIMPEITVSERSAVE